MSQSLWPDSLPLRRLAIVAGTVLLLALVFPGLLRVLFAADEEVSYSAGLSYTTCRGLASSDYSTDETCRVAYAIVVGNTGTVVQDEVRAVVQPVPADWRLGYNAQDIVASAERRAVPDISYVQTGDAVVITIGNLQPNRLVDLEMLSLGVESLRLFETSQVRLEADAAIVEASPRLTVVSRFARNVFSVFGF